MKPTPAAARCRGAVFFDYDGTLVNKEIPLPPPRIQEALFRLQQRGYLTIIATGRSLPYLPEVLNQFAFSGTITANGAYVEIGGETLRTVPLSLRPFCELLQYLEKKRVNYIVERQDICSARIFNSDYDRFVDRFSIPIDRILIQRTFSMLEGAHKINIIGMEHMDMSPLKIAFGEQFTFQKNREFPSWDITATGVDKADGVIAVCDHFSLAKQQTYCFGDGDNDRRMLQQVGTGISVTPHAPSLDDVAAYHTASLAKDGIVHALVHFGLIEPINP